MSDEKPKRGRPFKIKSVPLALESNVVTAEPVKLPKEQPVSGGTVQKKILAKVVQLGLGVDLLGSAMSLNMRAGNELEVTALGIKAWSKKTGRIVLIPWSNIKACELLK